MNQPYITYVIPYYNGQASIKRQLDSIYSLPLQPHELEVVLVDDHSPIPAETALEPLKAAYPGLTIVRHTENKRQGGAKNTGIQTAHGLYVAFADQDDTIAPEHIPAILHVAIEQQPDVIVCQANRLRTSGKVDTYAHNLSDSQQLSGIDFCEHYYNLNFTSSPWSNIYRRQFLLDQKRPMAEHTLLEDVDWVQHHLFFAKSIINFNRPIYNWHENQLSITHLSSSRLIAAYVAHGYRKIKNSQLFRQYSPQFADVVQEDGQFNISLHLKIAWKRACPWRVFNRNGCGEIEPYMWEAFRHLEWDKYTHFLIHHRTLAAILMTLPFPLRWASLTMRYFQLKRLSATSR